MVVSVACCGCCECACSLFPTALLTCNSHTTFHPLTVYSVASKVIPGQYNHYHSLILEHFTRPRKKLMPPSGDPAGGSFPAHPGLLPVSAAPLRAFYENAVMQRVAFETGLSHSA